MNDLLTDALAAASGFALALSLLGGFLGGVALSQPHKIALSRRLSVYRATTHVVMVAFLGSLFFVGRAAQALSTDEGHPGLLLGGWLLWLAFSSATGVGMYADNAWESWRVKRRERDDAPTT